MKDGNLGRVNKGITYSHVSLNSEEYDVKNDDNKRKKEKDPSRHLFWVQGFIYFKSGKKNVEGSTFFPLFSISFSSFTEEKWKKASNKKCRL